MSDALSIAAVTATLRRMLEKGVQGEGLSPDDVTTKPLDKARTGNASSKQLNLFLYQTLPNAALRNMDLPERVKPGETGVPPLALNLYYLLTAYGQNDDDLSGHRLLGKAMGVLHDHPVLAREELKSALSESNVHQQIERIRILPHTLSLDEMSKLWNTFQTQYRISAAYQVAVVLIESDRPAKTPLPVLARGDDDGGIASQPDLIPPFPTIESVQPPNLQPGAKLGDKIVLAGHHLAGDQVFVRLSNPRLQDSSDPSSVDFRIIGPLTEPADKRLEFNFPNQSEQWPVGIYGVSAVIRPSGEADRTSNESALAVVPGIVTVVPNPAPRNSQGNVKLTVTCEPHVLPEQTAALLLGDRQVKAEDHPAKTNTLEFKVANAPLGRHFVRLRVDGLDSILIDRTTTPPKFLDSAKIEITP